MTVAHADLRIALGAGLIAAALTIGGPVTAAFADPGNSGWGHSRNESGAENEGGWNLGRHDRDVRSPADDNRQERGKNGLSSDDGGRGWNGGSRGGNDRGGRGNDRGSRGGNDRNRQSPSHDSGAIGGHDVAAPTTSKPAASRPTVSPGKSPVTVAPTVQAPPSAPPADEAGSGSSTGVQGDAAPNTAPPVTVGNGRSPGLSWERPDEPNIVLGSVPPPVSSALAPPPPPPPVPVAVLIPSPAPASPGLIARIWEPLRPTFAGGPLFGIVGLVIMPLAGMWLGYRQARAARAAAELIVR